MMYFSTVSQLTAFELAGSRNRLRRCGDAADWLLRVVETDSQFEWWDVSAASLTAWTSGLDRSLNMHNHTHTDTYSSLNSLTAQSRSHTDTSDSIHLGITEGERRKNGRKENGETSLSLTHSLVCDGVGLNAHEWCNFSFLSLLSLSCCCWRCVCVLKVGSGEGGLSKTSAGDVTDAEWLDFM